MTGSEILGCILGGGVVLVLLEVFGKSHSRAAQVFEDKVNGRDFNLFGQALICIVIICVLATIGGKRMENEAAAKVEPKVEVVPVNKSIRAQKASDAIANGMVDMDGCTVSHGLMVCPVRSK